MKLFRDTIKYLIGRLKAVDLGNDYEACDYRDNYLIGYLEDLLNQSTNVTDDFDSDEFNKQYAITLSRSLSGLKQYE